MPDAIRIVLTLLAGVATGVLSGTFGIGGAVVSNPSIRALGASPIQSIGSTLPSIIPSAISGALRYRRDGLLHTRVVVWTGLTGAATSIGGSLLSDLIPGEGHALTMTIAVLMGYTAIRTAKAGLATRSGDVDATPVEPEIIEGPIAEADLEMAVLTDEDTASAPHEETWRLVLIGSVAGVFSGLLGIGGGLLMVPAFTGWLRLPLKETIGTSLACVGVIALPGMVTHALLGHIDWSFALPLAIGVIPGARLGAHLALTTADRTLRLVVAAGLASLGAVYATTELLALVN